MDSEGGIDRMNSTDRLVRSRNRVPSLHCLHPVHPVYSFLRALFILIPFLSDSC